MIDYLLPGVLLRTSFLALNSLDVVWAKNKDQVDALVYRDKQIRITIAKGKANQTPPYRTNIYANTSLVILPGTGVNVPVRHRSVPYVTKGYLITP